MSEEDVIKTFESIGIPSAQTKVYLELLKNSYSTATVLAKKTKMHRANVYDTLEKLKEKNLVYSTNKEGRGVFVALSADALLQTQKEKLENLKSAVTFIEKVHATTSKTPKVYVVEGVNALKNILFGLLEHETPIWIYGLAEKEEIMKFLNERIMNTFHLERIKKRILLKCLFYNYPLEKIKDFNKIKLAEARILPKTHQARSYQISQIVCGNNLYLTMWIQPIYTIVIENELIAKEYIDFYSFIWDHCEEIKK